MGTNLLDAELVKSVFKPVILAAFDILVQKYQHKVVNLVGSALYRTMPNVRISHRMPLSSRFKAINRISAVTASFTPGLYRIAANTAKNYLASRARKSPRYTVDVEDAEHFEGESRLKEY